MAGWDNWDFPAAVNQTNCSIWISWLGYPRLESGGEDETVNKIDGMFGLFSEIKYGELGRGSLDIFSHIT